MTHPRRPRPRVLHDDDRRRGARAARRAADHTGRAGARWPTPWVAPRPQPVTAAAALPGFARSTVDGFAVRAADTFGASEGLPAYLDVAGSVAMGRPAEVRRAARRRGRGAHRWGAARRRRRGGDGGAHPGHDARVGRGGAAGRTRRRHGARRRGRGAGAEIAPAGRPLRAQDLGMLAAAGVVEVSVHRRPRVGIVSTGDEVVPPETAGAAARARCGTRPPSALAGLVAGAGGEPVPLGIVGDDADELERVLRDALRALRRRGGLGRVLGRCPGRDRRRGGPAGRARDPLPRAGRPTGQADPAGRLRRGPRDRAAGQPAVGAGRVPAGRRPRSYAG